MYEAEKYNNWRKKVKARILSNIAPRINRLSRKLYMGCGFHYAMEQQLGKVIIDLSMPIQWCANHCDKIPDDRFKMINNRISVEMLIASVAEAEKSVKNKH